jgi:hypothetical protein
LRHEVFIVVTAETVLFWAKTKELHKGYKRIKKIIWIPQCITITYVFPQALMLFTGAIIHAIKYFSFLKDIINDNVIREVRLSGDIHQLS